MVAVLYGIFVRGTTTRILLIEPDEATRSVFADCLRDEGFRVDVAADVDEAALALRRRDVALAVVAFGWWGNLGSAVVSPREILARLRRVSPDMGVVAILPRGSGAGGSGRGGAASALATRTPAQIALEALYAGALEALVKPIGPDDLLLAVRRSLATIDLLAARPGLRRALSTYAAVRRILCARDEEEIAEALADATNADGAERALYAAQAAVAREALSRYPGATTAGDLDPLTELYDRSYLERALAHELARAERGGPPVAAIAVDLAGFREINDRHGHLLGGQVVVELARLVSRAVRDFDLVARVGPDEIGVVLVGTDRRDAERVAARIREAVLGHRFLAREGLDLRLAVEVGIACGPEPGDTGHTLLERAIRARRA